MAYRVSEGHFIACCINQHQLVTIDRIVVQFIASGRPERDFQTTTVVRRLKTVTSAGDRRNKVSGSPFNDKHLTKGKVAGDAGGVSDVLPAVCDKVYADFTHAESIGAVQIVTEKIFTQLIWRVANGHAHGRVS